MGGPRGDRINHVDGRRISVIADAGVFQSGVRGGTRWQLFQGVCEGTSQVSFPACFSVGAGTGSGGVLFSAAGGRDRRAGRDSDHVAVSDTGDWSGCAEDSPTRHTAVFSLLALPAAGAACTPWISVCS